ncbi:MAG: type IIL restriction-modification enzyme MmeI, partial [Polyangia bacterium]
GLVATNTVTQGDTRESGLDRIVADGGEIYAGIARTPWQGGAAVNVSTIWVHRGEWAAKRTLDDTPVDSISPALDAGGLTGKPERLAANANKSFQGSNVLGLGFTLTTEEVQDLVDKSHRNADVLFPYLNGKDLNTSPDQSPSRWVINFFDWPLEKASKYPDCMKIVRERVKPERDKVKRKLRRERWWRYAETAVNLYRTIAPLERVLVVARTSRTAGFCFVPTGTVYSEATVVFASGNAWFFAILQSYLHEPWARRYSSSLKEDLRYAPSDCFETFPFPASTDGLDDIGEEYHEHRRQLMLAGDEGLTKTYNRFHDPKGTTPGIQQLRDLHVEMDIAVRDAYGWTDLDLEHGWIETRTVQEKKNKKTGVTRTVEKVEHRFTISERARQEVLRRLLALNHERYAEEVAQGLHDKGKKKAPTRRKKPKKRPSKAPAAPKRQQLGLTLDAPTKPPPAPTDLSEEAGAVLAALDEIGDWASKGDILDKAGIPAARWTRAIGELLDAGKAERTGERRGTRYRRRTGG